MNEFIESPIIAIVGNKGAGKTLMMTGLAVEMHIKEGKTIYSNYKFNKVPYKEFDSHMLLELPESMKNGVICIDEAHMTADSYEFLGKNSKALTTLATQLRKRKLTLLMTTQRFSFLSKRMRDLTDYQFALEVARDRNFNIIKGVALVEVYDRANPIYDGYTKYAPNNKFTFDGRPFFGYYNTDEVIHQMGYDDYDDE